MAMLKGMGLDPTTHGNGLLQATVAERCIPVGSGLAYYSSASQPAPVLWMPSFKDDTAMMT